MRASFIFFLCLLSFLEYSQPMGTVIVDVLAEWKSPFSLNVGGSIVFKHLHSLCLFHNRRAFDRCSFAQASFVCNGIFTHFTWSPPRPRLRQGRGSPSPSDKQRSGGSAPCVSAGSTCCLRRLTGGDGSLRPDNTFPLVPREGTPLSALAPGGARERAGGGILFLSSNPAVPLPTELTDTASIQALPTGLH